MATPKKINEAIEALTPAMVRALRIQGMSTAVAWRRGLVQTQTMNRLDRAGLWVWRPRGASYVETTLGDQVVRKLVAREGVRR